LKRIASFKGTVRSRHDSQGALGLMLSGTDAQEDEAVCLAFTTSTPPGDLPPALQDPVVEQLSQERFRIHTSLREWLIEARAVHVHREVAAALAAAIPPRVPPLSRRLFWRLILGVAGNPLGLFLLRRLRG
jgi:hypothetical protein